MSATLPEVRIDAGTPTGRVVTLVRGRERAVVHEHGAHVTSWVPGDGHGEALFLSERALLDGHAAIRGGVPVIFPQFGPGPMPKHGFARTTRWAVDDAGVDGAGVPYARLALHASGPTRATWPHEFAAALTVRLEDGLAMTLEVTNGGASPLRFTGALHTYLRVTDVESVTVHGLEERTLRDQLTRIEAREGRLPLRVTGPVDRVYLDVPGPVRVVDEASGRTVQVATRGFPDVVVWNPWEDGARTLADMDDSEWRTMLCVEPAAAATPVELAPGARWTGEQRLTVEG